MPAPHVPALALGQFDRPPSPLNLWLETWRLDRLLKPLYDLGVDVKEDIIDMSDNDAKMMNMRLLEECRWKQVGR